MKARVKATGKIGIVSRIDLLLHDDFQSFNANEVEILNNYSDVNADYWTRLEHQYAGMAMQGMLNNSLLITGLLKVNKSHEDIVAEVTGTAVRYAHALVEKLKEKEERK